MRPRVLRLGTRGSALALVQSRRVASMLEERTPGVRIEIVEFHTSGDRLHGIPLGPHLGQAFFTKEIEEALRDGHVDLAVHSCKDLAATLPPGLLIGAVCEREDPRDALVGPAGGLASLPPGARVGTSSVRRKRFLSALRPDLEVLDQRGNVPTRVQAVNAGAFDAIVLAVAGLRRLGLEARISQELSPDVMVPAAGQGALAIEVREDDRATRALVARLDDPVARVEVTAERACLRRLGAGCQAPVGVLGRVQSGDLALRAAVAGSTVQPISLRGSADEAERLGTRAAERILGSVDRTTLRDAAGGGAGTPGIAP